MIYFFLAGGNHSITGCICVNNAVHRVLSNLYRHLEHLHLNCCSRYTETCPEASIWVQNFASLITGLLWSPWQHPALVQRHHDLRPGSWAARSAPLDYRVLPDATECNKPWLICRSTNLYKQHNTATAHFCSSVCCPFGFLSSIIHWCQSTSQLARHSHVTPFPHTLSLPDAFSLSLFSTSFWCCSQMLDMPPSPGRQLSKGLNTGEERTNNQ